MKQGVMKDVIPVPKRAMVARKRSRKIARWRPTVLPLIFAALVVACWQIGVTVMHVAPSLLPAPSAIMATLLEHLPFLLQQAIPTTLETIAGFVIATLLGIALAILVCASKVAREMVYPNIVVFQLIPKIALAPLFIVWLGIGHESRITFSVFISFFPVVVATLGGLLSVNPDLLRLSKAVGASERMIYLQVRFPAAVPQIFSGLKIAITFAMIGVIVGEFITAQAGLGYMIMFAASQADTALIMAAIVLLCCVGLGLYGVLALAEKAVLRRMGMAASGSASAR
jgi:NitT/TauT family transport system permease protein